MNSNVWAKTILSVYPYLIKVADAIDRIVERRALNSFYVSSTDFSRNNVYEVADKLIELGERKIVLINLKVLTENALKKCDRILAKMLIAKYFSRKKSREICEMVSIPTRTYFRKIKEAERAFEQALSVLGFAHDELDKMLSGEEWIMCAKEEFLNAQKEKEVILDVKKLKRKVAL